MKKKVNKMINANRIVTSILLGLIFSVNVNAQVTLSLQDAIKIALENNYEIRIATNNVNIAETNVTSGNAGMLPSVSATIDNNNNVQNLAQTRADESVTSLDNAKSNSMTYGINLGWTIFDGFKMFARIKQLRELQKLGEAELKLTILTKIGDVNETYYNLVQQQQQLAAIDSSIVISNQRLSLANDRFTIGKASKLEVLNAQVDMNTDIVTLLKQKELYANTKIYLNQILARDSKINFRVADSIFIDSKLDLEKLTLLSQNQNPQLETQIINKRIAELQLKQVKSGRYPIVKVKSGYNFSDNHSSLGYTTQSSARGLNYGFGASLNLFDGLSQNRNEKVAMLNIDNANVQIQQQSRALNSQLATAYQSYLTNLDLIAIEEKNEAIAKQNLDITLDKFRIGTITTLEFRTAQLNYVNAKVRFSDAQYQAKLSEISLRELAGNLVF